MNEDADVTVLDIGPTGRVTQLFPNPYQTDNHVLANGPLEIGGASGARVTVTRPVGAELIKVIASKRPMVMISQSRLRRHGAFFTVDGGVPTVLRDLQVVSDQTERCPDRVDDSPAVDRRQPSGWRAGAEPGRPALHGVFARQP